MRRKGLVVKLVVASFVVSLLLSSVYHQQLFMQVSREIGN